MLGAAGVVFTVITLFVLFNNGTIFFADADPGFAQVFVQARGNLSAGEKRDIVMRISNIVQTVAGIKTIYASSGGQNQGGFLNSNGGVPVDNIGQLGIEMKDYRERRPGKLIEEEIRRKTANIPGVHIEVREPQNGPPTGKDVMIDVSSDNYAELAQVAGAIRRIWTR